MAVIENWFPPSRDNFNTILFFWQLFPLGASLQWATSWYGMGKTSVNSRFNLPGRIAWFTMESPGFLTLLYMMNTIPQQEGIESLPWQNKVLAGLFVIHYSHRAVIFPLLQPSMSPIHAAVWISAMGFQVCNGTCLGAWLAGYGPTTHAEWQARLAPWPTAQFVAGLGIFYVGLAANYFHDEELREIRRRQMRRAAAASSKGSGKANGGAEKHYQIPQAGLFKYMLYPHYTTEWLEWLGFYIASGFSSAPARAFLLNEIGAMLPRAVRGRQWYAEKFGEEKIRGRWVVIPGVL